MRVVPVAPLLAPVLIVLTAFLPGSARADRVKDSMIDIYSVTYASPPV